MMLLGVRNCNTVYKQCGSLLILGVFMFALGTNEKCEGKGQGRQEEGEDDIGKQEETG